MSNYDKLSDLNDTRRKCEFCKYQIDGKCTKFWKNNPTEHMPEIDVSYYVTHGGSPDVCPYPTRSVRYNYR